tara:strand:+ start:7892 stop:9343 length:1452 start_codon:yes stop_codon:yes gene_type:complete
MINDNIKDWKLQNSYLELPDCFFEKIEPTVVKKPKLIYFNKCLAKNLNLNFLNENHSKVIDFLSGNKIPLNSKPVAQAYAGHQFGHFTMLGDGRAILLGQQKDLNGKLFDIQLKGSGRTPFSRGGDGRATLSSMLREYLISESMHHLKIPTTRSLAVIDTGEKVNREITNNGAVLTRIALSHIRVGTFEYGKYFCSKEDFKNFINYVIERHYPEILNHESPYVELLKIIINKQIDLIVNWVRVGFIHGVMNTDNTSITGETIDYGPCAFMNLYDPKTVFSSIDKQGRYAFGKQHEIAYWNLTVFAGTILQFIDDDKDKATKILQNILNEFPIQYSNKWYDMMFKKLGIINYNEEDKLLVIKLLKLMQSYKSDYTNIFASLTLDKPYNDALTSSSDFKNWHKNWRERIKIEKNSHEIMQLNNPLYIPRNNLVEHALKKAIIGNMNEFENLLGIISNTYNYDSKLYEFQKIPKGFDKSYKTFCGT